MRTQTMTKKTTQPLTYFRFELFRDVETCVQDNDGDIELGFEDAESEALALDDIKQRLDEAGLSKAAIRSITYAVDYVGTDSTNWTHAQATFNVNLTVPARHRDAVHDCFLTELEIAGEDDQS